MAELVQPKQISGLQGQTTLSFVSPQALAATDLSGVPDMTQIYVGTVNDQYIYRSSLSSPPTSDGLNVIAPAAPAAGRALRQYTRNIVAQTQSAWEVDPVNGDDRNSGLPGSPLQSLLEWSVRMRTADVQQNVIVTVRAGTLTDIGPLDLHIGTGILVLVQGTIASTAPSSFSALVSTNSSTNTRGTATDGAASFARSQRLRMTSGASAGAVTYTQGGTTSTVAQVTGWSVLAGLSPASSINPVTVNPSPGDNYVIDTIQTTFQGRMDIRVKGAGRFAWQDINFTSDPSNAFLAFQAWRPMNDLGTTAGVMFVKCSYDTNSFASFVGANAWFNQCIFNGSCVIGAASNMGCSDCVFQGILNVFSAFFQMHGAITLDGGRILQQNVGQIELTGAQVQAGATAVGGNCWEVDPGCSSYQHDSARLWGPTSGYSVGVRTYAMASFQYNVLPTLTGSSVTDALIAGNNKTWAQLPFADTTHLSQAVTLP